MVSITSNAEPASPTVDQTTSTTSTTTTDGTGTTTSSTAFEPTISTSTLMHFENPSGSGPPTIRTRSRTLSLSLTRTLSLSAAPTLDSLTLAHILNGETCPPISFQDFATFVSHKEFTSENLLFILWFRSYRHRYEELHRRIIERIPTPSAKMGDRYTPFAYLDKWVENGVVKGPRETELRDSLDGSIKGDIETLQQPPPREKIGKELRWKEGEFKPCAWTTSDRRCNCGNPATHSHQHSPYQSKAKSKSSWFSFGKTSNEDSEEEPPITPYRVTPILNPASNHPPLPPHGTPLMPAAEQPMREEAERAFATFMKKGGSRELGISDELRVFTRDTLARSTAPNCFLPIYEEIYHTIESQSLPAFLSQAKMNINRPKQLYWYAVGLLDFLIGSAFFILLTIFLRSPNYGYRLTRLPSIIFTSFGAMQFYSALRGFCSQVWGRASRQVQAWELDSVASLVDEETRMGGREMEEVEALPLTTLSGAGLGIGRLISQEDIRKVGDLHMDGIGADEEKTEELEITLPDGVHPLGDLVGVNIDNLPSDTFDISSTYSMVSPTSTSPELLKRQQKRNESTSSDEDDGSSPHLTDIQLRQLAIRRDTIKVPSSDLAFPIPNHTIPPPVSTIHPKPTHSQPGQPMFGLSRVISSPNKTTMGIFDNDISPFAAISPGTTGIPSTPPLIQTRSRLTSQSCKSPSTPSSPNSKDIPEIPSTPFKRTAKPIKRQSQTQSILSQHRIPSDLTTLLVNFRRSEPADPDAYRNGSEERERRTRIFGPERVIEDPRIKGLMSRIVNEILIVGIIVGVITIVLCFAVPMRLS